MKKYQTDSLAQVSPVSLKLSKFHGSVDDFRITKKNSIKSLENLEDRVCEV